MPASRRKVLTRGATQVCSVSVMLAAGKLNNSKTLRRALASLLAAWPALTPAALGSTADTAKPPLATAHWSLQPLSRPPVPDTAKGKGPGKKEPCANPIDAFILAKLAAQKLGPAP